MKTNCYYFCLFLDEFINTLFYIQNIYVVVVAATV